MGSKIGFISKEFVEFGTQLHWGRNKSLQKWNIAVFNNGVEISVKDVANVMKHHMRPKDWLNLNKIIIAVIQSFDLLAGTDNVKGGTYKFSDSKNWKFPIYETAYECLEED